MYVCIVLNFIGLHCKWIVVYKLDIYIYGGFLRYGYPQMDDLQFDDNPSKIDDVGVPVF